MSMETNFSAWKCLKCLRRFVPPFSKCLRNHFVCGGCQHHKQVEEPELCSSEVVKREALDDLGNSFNDFKEFCQFGCGVRRNLTELVSHEDSCVRRDYAAHCLIDNCSWRGFTSGLISHVDSAHPNSIMINCKQRRRVLDISRDTSITLVLLYDRSYYCNVLYWVQMATEDDRRFVKVVHQGNIGAIKHNDLTHYTVLCLEEQLQDISIQHSKDTTSDHVAAFDITKIETDTIQIYLKSYGSELIPKYLATKLECPACTGMLRSPVNVCSAGHSTCGVCRVKSSNKCLTCSKDILDVRNYAIEKLTENYSKDCTNAGCLESIQAGSCSDHLKVCHYREVFCGGFCGWQGPLDKFSDHGDYHMLNGNGIPSPMVTRYYIDAGWVDNVMIAFDKVFALSYSCEPDNFITIRVLELTTAATSDFNYDIQFRNATSGYKLEFTGACIAYDNDGRDMTCEILDDKNGLPSLYDDDRDIECVLLVFKP